MSNKAAKGAAQIVKEPFETLKEQLAPMGDEAKKELFGFLPEKYFGNHPAENAHAKEEARLKGLREEERAKSEEEANKIVEAFQKIKAEYTHQESKTKSEQQAELQDEIAQLQEEIAALAKMLGEETTVPMENTSKEATAMDVKRLSAIAKDWRLKADKAESGKDLEGQTGNSKPSTGMLAWVSGKQMKIHEQGTMQLQG